MGDVGLFIAGVLVTIPAAAGFGALILAAFADGRENDAVRAGMRAGDDPPADAA